MKILITGAKGQLGSQLLNMLKKCTSELGKIPSLYENSEVFGLSKEALDITSFAKVEKELKDLKPDIVINTAAYTNVDGCETNKDLAFTVNALGPKNLAIVCDNIKAKLIHISTDYVFNGNSLSPYNEYDIPNPINVYGKTKYLGEEYIRHFCSKYFIIRTSWLYGYNGNNFVKTIVRAAKYKGTLSVVNNQTGNPTNVEDLAYHILKIALTNEYGIYHCTGNGQCTWYDFAYTIIKYANIDCVVNSVTSSFYKTTAERPSNSSLDNMMLRVTIGDKMRNWQNALKEFIQNYNF